MLQQEEFNNWMHHKAFALTKVPGAQLDALNSHLIRKPFAWNANPVEGFPLTAVSLVQIVKHGIQLKDSQMSAKPAELGIS